MNIGIYPGSFDPITMGHLDIIERAVKVCDHVVVSVITNPNKNPMFTLEERVALIESLVTIYDNVTVDCFSGLLIDYAKIKNANVIIKGLRAVSDFEYECQMAIMNKKLAPNVETVFLMSNNQYSYLSSSMVKEVATLGGCIKGLVPEEIEREIMRKIHE